MSARPRFARVSRLDQAFKHFQRRILHAVPERDFLAAREFLDRRHQPTQELIPFFQCRPEASAAIPFVYLVHENFVLGASPPIPQENPFPIPTLSEEVKG